MDKAYAQYLLKKTQADYNLIAGQFSSTRKFMWRDLLPFLDYTSSGNKVLDVGCGNGRLFNALKDKKIDYVGVDVSEKLIAEARNLNPQANFQIADILNLPFDDNYFDKIYCVAVLHHIPSKELRIAALREIKRVLKPKGLAIITVWNLWQRKTHWQQIITYPVKKILGISKLDFRDLLEPWKSQKGEIMAQRYVHAFTQKELGSLAEQAGFAIKKIGVTERPEKKDNNIYLVLEK